MVRTKGSERCSVRETRDMRPPNKRSARPRAANGSANRPAPPQASGDAPTSNDDGWPLSAMGYLGHPEAERLLEAIAPQEKRDAEAMASLHIGLEQFVPHSKSVLTRHNAIALLEVIKESLIPALYKPVAVSAQQPLAVHHPAMVMLMELLDALSDLDRGKANKIFRAASDQTHAALPLGRIKLNQALIETVDQIQRGHKLKTRRQAERILAGNLRSIGFDVDGTPVTAGMLKSVRDHMRKRK